MALELTEEEHKVLVETRAVDTPAEFQVLSATSEPEMARIMRVVMQPNQGVGITSTVMRDLYLTVINNRAKLKNVRYGPERVALFRDSIRMLDTVKTWFGEKLRGGVFRPRTVAQIVQASRPWRDRLSRIGGQAFVFEDELAQQFADVNSTGTLEEEIADLQELNTLVKDHQTTLEDYGLTPELIAEGKTLHEEASGRDLLGVLGLRNKDEAKHLLNRIVTYAVRLGREARAAGRNAASDDPELSRRFEAASFAKALRSVRRHRGPRNEPETEDDEPEEKPEPEDEEAGDSQ